MTTAERISELVIKMMKGKLTKEQLKPEASLRDDLNMDSLSMSELLVLSEDVFKISISLEEAQKVTTLAEIITCVDKHCAGRAE